MKLLFARTKPHRRAESPAQELLDLYLARIQRLQSCDARDFPTEAKLAEHLDRAAQRTRPILLLADSRGLTDTSEAFAQRLGKLQDQGAQELVFAIGPPDGWTPAFLARADLTLAFGRLTLPHELAAIVFAEQIYRALTILAGHPYHTGH